MRQLTARVQSGPYRGLFTTPERRAFVQGLSADTGAVARPSDRIQVSGSPPPATCSHRCRRQVPPSGSPMRPRTRRYRTGTRETGRTPTLVVDTRGPGESGRRPRTPFVGQHLPVSRHPRRLRHLQARGRDGLTPAPGLPKSIAATLLLAAQRPSARRGAAAGPQAALRSCLHGGSLCQGPPDQLADHEDVGRRSQPCRSAVRASARRAGR